MNAAGTTPYVEVLLINVGSNSNEKNGIAPIYPDGKFEYWPIEESYPGPSTPRFRDLCLNCPNQDLFAHYDPRFEPTPTYGDKSDVKVFGDMAETLKRGGTPLLVFAATLKCTGEAASRTNWIVPGIGYYIIGFFDIQDIQVCRDGKNIEWEGQEHNAHYLRPDHDAGNIKVLVKGAHGCRLLRQAFPISYRPNRRLEPTEWFKTNFRELRGGLIGGGPWVRRSYRNAPGVRPSDILNQFLHHE